MKDNILKYSFLILLGFLFFFFVFGIEILHRVELNLYNLRFELKAHKKNNDIVLILVDEKTRKKYNYKYVPYSEYARVVSLGEKAKVIGIDNALVQFTDINDIKEFSNVLRNKTNVILSSYFVDDLSDLSSKNITYVTPIPIFSESLKYGYHNYFADIDNYTRRTNIAYYFQSPLRIEKSFAYLVASFVDPSVNEDNKNYLINYIGKEDSFVKYSFRDVLENSSKYEKKLKDKIILIGSDADIYKAPFLFNNKITRVEIHANNILTILKRNYIKKSSTLFNIIFLILMFLTGLFTANFFNRKQGSYVIISISLFYFFFNIILFCIFNWYLNIFTPTLSLIFSFFAVKTYLFDNKNREISNVKNIFKRYLAPQMLDEFIKRKDYVEALKGERRVVSVLFADIADFTSISERLPTDQVVRILNEFLSKMTDIIFRNKGTLDKYTGDGVMAVFGNIGKINTQENTIRAVRTAIEMNIELEILQKKWISEGFMPFQIRIGISTGEAVVGNIGSPQQKDFTVIGDTVNTAARLEKLNKEYNTSILVNRETYENVKNVVKIKNLGSAKLKGKDQMVDVFEVLGMY